MTRKTKPSETEAAWGTVLPPGHEEKERLAAASVSEALDEASPMLEIEVDDPESYGWADADLARIVRLKDHIAGLRAAATGPLKAGVKLAESWSAKGLAACETAEAHLKAQIKAYRLRGKSAEAEAARLVKEGGKSADITRALNEAAEIEAATDAGKSGATFFWEVDTVDEELLPEEWKIVDYDGLNKAAKKHKGPKPPEVEGVTFKLGATISARRD